MKKASSRNKTIDIAENEKKLLSSKLITLNKSAAVEDIINKTINQDLFEAVKYLPENFVDLLIMDPPYNLNKKFNNSNFKIMPPEKYGEWLDSFIPALIKTLKPNASLYICGDWRSAVPIQIILGKYLKLRNRITWEREKGRGAKTNWKNNSEDIWFFTVSDNYTFNFEDVKLKKKVIAPYKLNGRPKDWEREKDGNFRLTFPSNIWTDISVPFWSMSENTEHPTQKPEKLIAKIILASSDKGDVVFDPFLGSGTTSVAAKKLERRYVGIELDRYYSLIAEKRLLLADDDKMIQGYSGGVFWERNSVKNVKSSKKNETISLF